MSVPSDSVDTIITSPPFALRRKKPYGNVDAERYLDWFRPFARQFRRVLKPRGSLLFELGGVWNRGSPTRSLYHYELLLDLCTTHRFHLAQEFYCYNRAKLPTPAQWVTVRRVRVKDAVSTVWWLSKSKNPKASNRRVLSPYSASMVSLLEDDYSPGVRPSGHRISRKFRRDNKGAIPPNLLVFSNTASNSHYLRRCRQSGLAPHPARFPREVPEFFIKLLTTKGDLVLDPFAGSCVTGAVAEELQRRWLCFEIRREYLEGARFRFEPSAGETV
jgi:site-specific DNA-methyltransferase (cytosine-N4-specific)